MKKENRELLLKDLCARLPYGVIVEYGCKYEGKDLGEKKSKLTGRMIDSFFGSMQIGMSEVYSLQPYLRPISSMTKEELEELNCLCYHNISIEFDHLCGYICFNEIEDVTDFLLRKHLDFRDLIPKGLALSAPEGMYNEIKEE